MKIAELMTRNVRTCAPDDTLHAAAALMWEADCGCLPVVDSDRRVVGMLTDRDVCMAAFTQGVTLNATFVSSAMSRRVYAASADDSVSNIEKLMQEKQVRRVPIVDERERLVGIVSLADLARHTDESRLTRAINALGVAKTLAAISERRQALPSGLGS